MVRAFLAMPLDTAVREHLVRWQQAWAQTVSNVKWVEQENLHLTLKFLGEVREEELGAIKGVAARIAAAWSPLVLALGDPGVFPNGRQARVLWVGLKDEEGRLAAMAGQLDHELASLGFPPEEGTFVPHLTLGRLRVPGPITLPSGQVTRVVVNLRRIVLYRSTLTPRGPQYHSLSSFELGKPELKQS